MSTTDELRMARAVLRMTGPELVCFVRLVLPNASSDSRWFFLLRLLEYAESVVADVPRET